MKYLDHTLVAYSNKSRYCQCSVCGLILFEDDDYAGWCGNTRAYTLGGATIYISNANGSGWCDLKNLTCNEVLVRGIIK